MTRLLLDSHVALWWLAGQQLAPEARAAIRDPTATAVFSIASVWELSIKQGLGRLLLPADYLDVLADEGIDLLGIEVAHARAVRDLPPLHRDPFDRMLVAQAQVEGLTLVTRDPQVSQYDVAVLGA